MAISWTDLCNKSLARLGVSLITSVDDQTPTGGLCSLQYPCVRDSLLRSHNWNCATIRAQLSQDKNVPIMEWAYSYTLPVDCLKVQRIFPRVPYAVESGHLLTNLTPVTPSLTGSGTANPLPVNIVYTQQVINPNQLDSLLSDAFVAGLAVVLCPKLKTAVAIKDLIGEANIAYQIALDNDA
jgi:hypothetical protein